MQIKERWKWWRRRRRRRGISRRRRRRREIQGPAHRRPDLWLTNFSLKDRKTFSSTWIPSSIILQPAERTTIKSIPWRHMKERFPASCGGCENGSYERSKEIDHKLKTSIADDYLYIFSHAVQMQFVRDVGPPSHVFSHSAKFRKESALARRK